MAVDLLQNKIKKQGNTLMLNLTVSPEDVPLEIVEQYRDYQTAAVAYAAKLMQGLKGKVCAVRFSVLHFALMGASGLSGLSGLLKTANQLGYYSVLEIPGVMSYDEAGFSARQIWGEKSEFPCDAVLVSGYPGSDVIKPFAEYCDKQKKDLFVIVRSTNKSASEVQDLLSGSRMVHLAAADIVNRHGAATSGKYGYTRVGIAASATSGDSIKLLRLKYPKLFMLIDGIEQPGGNAKNCSYAFDRMGHGAIVCVGNGVTAAWKESRKDYLQSAIDEIDKVQNRINRYITVM